MINQNAREIDLKKALFLLFIFLQYFPLYAQTTKFDSTVTAGIKQIYDIKFDSAEETFRNLIADYPNKPQGKFFLAMVDWWKIMLNPDNESYDDIFFQKLEDVINQCDNLLNKNPKDVDALFFKGGSIGFRGRLHAFRESWLKAADDGRQALPIVEKAAKLDPNNVDVQLGFGIYDYYADIIPAENPFIKPLMLFFPSGDKKKGLKELNNVAYNGKYAKYEARYFLMTLYYHYENNPTKAEEYSKLLIDDFPDNPVFERWYGRISAKRGDYAKAAKIFNDVLKKSEEKYAGYSEPNVLRESNYYVGLQYKSEDKLDSAKIYFTKCAEISRKIDKKEESGFLINSILYLGMMNDAQGKRDIATNYYKQVLDMREFGRSRKLAEQYLDKPYSK